MEEAALLLLGGCFIAVFIRWFTFRRKLESIFKGYELSLDESVEAEIMLLNERFPKFSFAPIRSRAITIDHKEVTLIHGLIGNCSIDHDGPTWRSQQGILVIDNHCNKAWYLRRPTLFQEILFSPDTATFLVTPSKIQT